MKRSQQDEGKMLSKELLREAEGRRKVKKENIQKSKHF